MSSSLPYFTSELLFKPKESLENGKQLKLDVQTISALPKHQADICNCSDSTSDSYANCLGEFGKRKVEDDDSIDQKKMKIESNYVIEWWIFSISLIINHYENKNKA